MRKFFNRINKSESGFTLIELLVVVIILGILASIAVVAVSNARTTAIAKACKEDAVTQLKALDNYYLDNNAYPTLSATPGAIATPGNLVPTYLHSLAPQTSAAADAGSYFLQTNVVSGSASVAGFLKGVTPAYTSGVPTNNITGCSTGS